MAYTNVKFREIQNTLSWALSNLQEGQSMLLTDQNNGQLHRLNTNYYITNIAKYTANGSSWSYVDNECRGMYAGKIDISIEKDTAHWETSPFIISYSPVTHGTNYEASGVYFSLRPYSLGSASSVGGAVLTGITRDMSYANALTLRGVLSARSEYSDGTAPVVIEGILNNGEAIYDNDALLVIKNYGSKKLGCNGHGDFILGDPTIETNSAATTDAVRFRFDRTSTPKKLYIEYIHNSSDTWHEIVSWEV